MSQVDIVQFLRDTNLGAYAGLVSETAQFPPQTTALMALGIASQVASLAVSVAYANGKPIPTGLICVGEQPSGAAKSRVMDSFRKHFERRVKEANDYKVKVRARIDAAAKAEKRELFEAEQKEYDRACPISIGLKSATIEAVENVAFRQSGYFALSSSEKGLINTLLGLAYGDSSKKSCDDLILNGYDGDYYEVGRANADRNGAGYVYGSLCIIAQDGVIDSLIDKSDGSGLAERVLFLIERGLMGCRDWVKILTPQSYENIEELELRYNNRVDDILELASTRENMEIFSLLKLRLSSESWALMAEYMNDNEHRVGFRGQYENSVLSGAYSKKVPNIMKLAATLYLFEVDTNGEKLASYIKTNNVIPLIFVERAMQIIDQIFNGMVHLCEIKGVAGTDRESEAIILWMGKHKGKMYKESEIKRALKNTQPFKSMAPNDKSDAIIRALERAVKSCDIELIKSELFTMYAVR